MMMMSLKINMRVLLLYWFKLFVFGSTLLLVPLQVDASDDSESSSASGTFSSTSTSTSTSTGTSTSSSPSSSPSPSSGSSSIPRTKTLVQCHMDASLDEILVFNAQSGIYKRPKDVGMRMDMDMSMDMSIDMSIDMDMDMDMDLNLSEDESLVEVRDCWCARVLNRPQEYCSSGFDTCQVQGSHGPILCFSNETKINVVRGIWPFCLFWILALIYMWIASEPGRRARGFLKRHLYNFVHDRQIIRNTRQRQRQRQRQEQDEHENEHEHEPYPLEAAVADDTHTRGVTVAAPDIHVDVNVDVDVDVDFDVEAPSFPEPPGSPVTELDDNIEQQEYHNESQQDSFPRIPTLEDSHSTQLSPSPSPQQASATLQEETFATLPPSTTTVQEGPPLHVQDDGDDDEEEQAVASLADDATHVTLRTIAPDHSFPPEFRSRSNYLQLLQELCHMYRYEPDRMAQLWHAAWVHERRRELRQLRRRAADNIRTHTTRTSNTGDDNDNDNDNGQGIGQGGGDPVMLPSAFWGTSIANTTATTTRTTQLSLKTKRYETPQAEENNNEENDNKDKDKDTLNIKHID
jgi:hypothetical protein